MREFDEGLAKWAVLGATVGVLEYVGEESLTSAFNRAMECPRMRYVALGGLAITACHLLGKIPRPIDPFYMIQDRLHHE